MNTSSFSGIVTPHEFGHPGSILTFDGAERRHAGNKTVQCRRHMFGSFSCFRHIEFDDVTAHKIL